MDPFRQPNRFARAVALGAALMAVPGLSACASDDISEMTLANTPPNLAVDPFLWEGAIETLAFLPPGTQDPATGRIVTGWGNVSKKPGEEVRAIVQIYPGDLSANSVAVTVERRVNGSPASVAADTAATVQEAILLRARQLRASIDE